MGQSQFGTPEAKLNQAISEMNKLPDVKLPNFGFENQKDLTFRNNSKEWGLNHPTFTNGTAYADLDEDGDLDLVLNNIDMPAMIFENRMNEISDQKSFTLKFDENVAYAYRIGTKVWLYHNGHGQYFEYSPYRGYKSTMDPDIHIGVGDAHYIDSLIVQWPDGNINKMIHVRSDTVLTINRKDLIRCNQIPYIADLSINDRNIRFQDISIKTNLIHQDIESSVVDIAHISTLIHNLSQYGPGICVGDINGDQLDDLFIGGDINQPGHFFIQQVDASFFKVKFESDSIFEDMGSLLFDADTDGDPDLYVVSGGSGSRREEMYQDRLYFNDGKGNFTRSTNILPSITSSGSCVIAGDYDKDGDLDLFIGSRLDPWEYPVSGKSYLLENQNGTFIDISHKLGATNGEMGMVTSALWTDVNNDNNLDLMVVGEWMPIKVFLNVNREFQDVSASFGLKNTDGWWNSINGHDMDNDGDTDYLLGNYGLNSFFKASVDRPVEIHAGDFDQNGSIDPIVTHYIEGQSYIVHPRNILNRKIPGFQNRFETFEKYGQTPYERSFTEEEKQAAIHLKCTMMESIVLENINGETFEIHDLPNEVQFSPIYGSVFFDFNNDRLTDILLVGNSYAEETITGYYDASYGNVLVNKGDFQWSVPYNDAINLIADGDKKALVRIALENSYAFLISENNGPLQVLTSSQAANDLRVQLNTNDWYALAIINENSTKKIEFYYGNGYLSQNSRWFFADNANMDLEIANYKGELRKIFE
jgi:hypothetical protein